MTLYIQERMYVPVGKHAPFFEAAQQDYLPGLEELEVRQVGIWRVGSIKGDPREIIALWEVDNWSHAAQFADAMDNVSNRSPLAKWRATSQTWLQGRSAAIFRNRSSTPPILEALKRPEMAGGFVWHETIDVGANQESNYVLGIEVQMAPSWDLRGIHLLALLQPVFKSNEIVNIWAAEYGFEVLDKSNDRDEDEFFNGPYWLEIATSLRPGYRSVLGEPTPLWNSRGKGTAIIPEG
jgi:hypothetical protein